MVTGLVEVKGGYIPQKALKASIKFCLRASTAQKTIEDYNQNHPVGYPTCDSMKPRMTLGTQGYQIAQAVIAVFPRCIHTSTVPMMDGKAFARTTEPTGIAVALKALFSITPKKLTILCPVVYCPNDFWVSLIPTPIMAHTYSILAFATAFLRSAKVGKLRAAVATGLSRTNFHSRGLTLDLTLGNPLKTMCIRSRSVEDGLQTPQDGVSAGRMCIDVSLAAISTCWVDLARGNDLVNGHKTLMDLLLHIDMMIARVRRHGR